MSERLERSSGMPRAGEVTLEKPESVKRAPRRTRRAAKSELPQFVAPRLATLGTLTKKLPSIRRDDSPFADPPRERSRSVKKKDFLEQGRK